LLAYFVFELLLDLSIYRNSRQFFKDRWLDILLVLPFLTVIRGTTRLLRLLKGLKSLKGLKILKEGNKS